MVSSSNFKTTSVNGHQRYPPPVVPISNFRWPIGPDAYLAPEIIKTHLSNANFNYAKDIEGGRAGPPTVRVVRKGTFMEYRAWKIKQMGISFVQAKIPVVTWDKELVTWLEERVDTELVHRVTRKDSELGSFIERLRSQAGIFMPCFLVLVLVLHVST
jgi:hypothetical protein